jgi:hypothetical protein
MILEKTVDGERRAVSVGNIFYMNISDHLFEISFSVDFSS